MNISYVDAQTSETIASFTFGSGDAIPSIGDDVLWDGGAAGGSVRHLRVIRRRFVLRGETATDLEIVLDAATEVGRVGI
ncbi:MAG: hypothetical protein IAI49_16435 [Candidatus Eremiobacteraeota bacterium]|nr:hypothetical protein [Candidatus Eremiobacteraeota bacterium]